MAIIIKTEKVITEDMEKGRKIIYFKALHKWKLPKKYLEGRPVTYAEQGWNNVFLSIYGKDTSFRFAVGSIIPEFRFKAAMKIIVEAGNRLQEINKQMKKLQSGWNDKETFTI